MGETGTSWRAAAYLTRTLISGGGGGPPPPSSRACTTIPLGRTSHPGLSSAAAASDHPLLDPPSELGRSVTDGAMARRRVRVYWCKGMNEASEGRKGIINGFGAAVPWAGLVECSAVQVVVMAWGGRGREGEARQSTRRASSIIPHPRTGWICGAAAPEMMSQQNCKRMVHGLQVGRR
jgi:hypothetical protein